MRQLCVTLRCPLVYVDSLLPALQPKLTLPLYITTLEMPNGLPESVAGEAETNQRARINLCIRL
jgi:hypothetical protein